VLAPPILEVYVVWHPEDPGGERAAQALMDHFHGPTYAGLAGGAVEVYTRSAGWMSDGGAPRPLPGLDPLPGGLQPAQYTVIVPVLGPELARAVRDHPAWREYMTRLYDSATAAAGDGDVPAVTVFSLRDPHGTIGGPLADLSGPHHALAPESATDDAVLCREVAQAIVQWLRGSDGMPPSHLTVFVSHTKHHTPEEAGDDLQLYTRVRQVLMETRLGEFFDASDLQSGDDWAARLDVEAGRSALLMVRTDRYAGREWTQREVLTAKRHDLPTVALSALRVGEDRGSFLMDHLPVVACHESDVIGAITRALNRLVDEALKGALWARQSVYLRKHGFDWLPAHAPEPITVVPWLDRRRRAGKDPHVWILHPDPPLGPRERDVIVELCALAGVGGEKVDILTPRTFAARGGSVPA
jgi:hypothetical protein